MNIYKEIMKIEGVKSGIRLEFYPVNESVQFHALVNLRPYRSEGDVFTSEGFVKTILSINKIGLSKYISDISMTSIQFIIEYKVRQDQFDLFIPWSSEIYNGD